VLEVTARIPCATLAAQMQDPRFCGRFRRAERPGVPCRVIREGYVESGDAIRGEPYVGETVSVLRMFRDFYDPRPSEAAIPQQFAAPIGVRARVQKAGQLAKPPVRGRP
jgi:MOSC domain-containing protein YiiM